MYSYSPNLRQYKTFNEVSCRLQKPWKHKVCQRFHSRWILCIYIDPLVSIFFLKDGWKVLLFEGIII